MRKITVEQFAKEYLPGRRIHVVRRIPGMRPDFVSIRKILDESELYDCVMFTLADWSALYVSYRRDGKHIVSRKLQKNLWVMRQVDSEDSPNPFYEVRKKLQFKGDVVIEPTTEL